MILLVEDAKLRSWLFKAIVFATKKFSAKRIPKLAKVERFNAPIAKKDHQKAVAAASTQGYSQISGTESRTSQL